jgi:hypothetical protein
MTRLALLGAAGLATLACAACVPPRAHAHRDHMERISALDCPSEQGDLELKSGGSGQQKCVYATDSGGQVTLQLVSLDNTDAQAALKPLEAQLKTQVPAAARDPETSVTAAGPGGWGAQSGDAHDGEAHGRVDLDLPGLHIHTHGDGQADVDTAGVHIHAHDGEGQGQGTAQVVVGNGVHIDAHEGGAQIRVAENGSGVRLSYFLASDTPGPNGYRMGAYEARGPSGGPIVVAEILAKDKDSDDLRHDARQLLRLNVGG